MSSLTRRQLLQTAGAALLGASGSGGVHAASAASSAGKSAEPARRGGLRPLQHFPRMVHEYLVGCVRDAERTRNESQAKVRTRADAEAHVRAVREKTQQSLGPWPEKTPLNARITGTLARDGYRIEKLIYESRPDFPVTGNLYVPEALPLPRPAVVGVCGHNEAGKAAEAYQSFAQGLARQGYVVLIIDPIGQGERLQYHPDPLAWHRGNSRGVHEHLFAGNQQMLVGEFFGAWRAWDAIRALDYLLTRPEVDPARIGVTGNSGGGTDSTWLCAADTRWAMAAPSCFVTTLRRNLENELPGDSEQCPPRAHALGLDLGDFIAAMAPKPVLLLGQERDFFDVRGLEETFAWLQHLYRLLGAEENIGMFIGPGEHGYSRDNREAMYRWFNRVARINHDGQEPTLRIEPAETLRCTPDGTVGTLRARTVFSFTRERAGRWREKRPALDGAELRRAINSALKLPGRHGVPEYRILRPHRSRGYPKPHAGVYAVETEKGVFALVYRLHDTPLVSRPPRATGRALLYVADASADAELREEPLITELIRAEPDATFYACDVRGVGESRPNTCGDLANPEVYGHDYFYAMQGLMLDRPYVGQRTQDVLRVIEWLGSLGHGDVHLTGRGCGALPATFAALLAPQVKQVTLKHALTSYGDIAETEFYKWPVTVFVPGVLENFDLPDCYRELTGKALRQIEPRDAARGPAA